MSALVRRWGRTGFALASSLLWALPAAYWAGSVDLVGGPGPWIGLAVAGVMLVVWVGLLAVAARVPVPPRPRRLALAEMSGRERRWVLAAAAVLVLLIGELNAAATVDWSLIGGAGRAREVAFLLGALAVVAVTVAALLECWRRADREFRTRRDS
ncbi:MAG TPA: hypothetical protein VF134_02715 [Candidatus Dormibacteraeota bacterium]